MSLNIFLTACGAKTQVNLGIDEPVKPVDNMYTKEEKAYTDSGGAAAVVKTYTTPDGLCFVKVTEEYFDVTLQAESAAKLVSIGSRAFKGCMNLSVTIPVGVTLGGEAFNGVYKVTSLLADNADNSALISSYIGAVMNVSDTNITLSGRTLLKDGSWNTLCLPFSLTAGNIAASPLAGATIKELDNSADGTNLTDGTLTLKFKDATSIEAGKPYIVKWTTTGDAITDPTFRDPAFDNSTEAQANMTVTSYDQNVKFVGQWSPFTIGDTSNGTYDGDINEIIYVAAGNKIGYSSKARTLKSCRAHFWVKPNGTQQAASMINVDFGDGTSSITPNSSLTPNPSPKGEGSDYWYDMSGRKLSQQPTQKGLYIHNGRKVVIK